MTTKHDPKQRQRELSRQRVAERQARLDRGERTAEDDDWDATGDAYDKKLKRDAAKRDAEEKRKAREQHQQGVRDERERAKNSAAAARKRTAQRRKVTTTTKRTTKRVPAQIRSARSGSVVGLFVASIALVGLYAFLAGAREVPGFLAGIQKAIQWLASPTAVIPFKEGS